MDDDAETKAQEERPLSAGELEAGASRDGGEPGKGGLGVLFLAAAMALGMVLALVALIGYFAMKP